ncbi:poly(3-hydroxybutyrate) depolymerase [Chromobacterium violaceum]|uniref:extracellular catalytic domain type 2 short-chain-length polyhydroxyalkanoate depolymerase n=1 Tax=Chromobacterium violaceum TaxID=536 RepID=UPI0009DB5FEC|nr:poly(3-hydroxybutyrate) depolymerase [Chromobacterium violaceum]OQS11282.1 poly(3-hydroxybutyrate) depolymerase [Chromobacterium violaceum]OQS27707.1 poly(3-hydroxybutyrate) depolymerase [Chromobacterium violaceum]
MRVTLISRRHLAPLLLAAACGQAAAAAPPLPALGANPKQSTVSGLSSGAFMAAQFSVANSASIAGAGIVAGGPFYCAGLGGLNGPERFLTTATTQCMRPLGAAPSGAAAWQAAQKFAQQKLIDPVDNIKRQRLYIFTGASDSIVLSKVVAQTRAFYQSAGVPDKQVRYVDNVNAGHALITANATDLKCPANAAPNLNNCGFVQSQDILRQLYGHLKPPAAKLSGQLKDFDQTEFAKKGYTGLSDTGHVYIPAACAKGGCRVHVAFHGCTQEDGRIGNRYYATTGYNEIADSNHIVVLYPQIRTDPKRNPQGCWDFWGYSSKDPANPDYYAKNAPQMSAIRAMLDRLNSHRK